MSQIKMNPINRLNLLLSDILQTEPLSTTGTSQGSVTHPTPLLTFAKHDCHSSSMLPSITAIPSIMPLVPRRNAASLKHHRRHQSDMQKQQQQQPLLNSSTLDDLFRALTLECEQYLAASSTSNHQNKIYGQLLVQPATVIQSSMDSNDDDYENLHSSNLRSSDGISSLKTSIEVMRPEKRQVLSINVSSKLSSSSPLVTSSRTYPLLSTSCRTTSSAPPVVHQSSEEDSLDISTASTNRKRRRRLRKQPLVSSIVQSSSSSDERTETTNDKKSIVSKRSCSTTDHRQQRIKSIYDNQPISLPSQKPPIRRIRRRDTSLQQNLPISTKHYHDISSGFVENLCSPLSVLLTSTRPTSDFVGHLQQQQQQQQPRRSRVELINHQPLSLLDRMHHQFYQASPIRHHNNPSNIPTHRIPSYPVY